MEYQLQKMLNYYNYLKEASSPSEDRTSLLSEGKEGKNLHLE